MKILITSGGTQERIDEVRVIKNTSTGRLGKLIAEAFVHQAVDVDFVHGLKAMVPKGVVSYCVEDVDAVVSTLTKLLKENTYDVIVHAMAISDYKVQSVTTIENVRENIEGKDIEVALKNYPEDFNRRGKLSSDYDHLVVMMRKAPKVISLLRTYQPNSIIVGFKLLVDVTPEKLIDVGHNLLIKNNCDYVLANDLKEITEDKHVGYLIDAHKNYCKYTTKQEIADGIVKAVQEARK